MTKKSFLFFMLVGMATVGLFAFNNALEAKMNTEIIINNTEFVLEYDNKLEIVPLYE